MRKWLLAVSIIVVFYLDNVLVTSLPLRGLRPDLTLAFVVSLGVLTGSVPAAAIGFGMGLAADIFFNKIVGLTALTYMLSGAAAGLFYRKFYADNLIIPDRELNFMFTLRDNKFLAYSSAFCVI
jgi:rod shape-determining protein MreD